MNLWVRISDLSEKVPYKLFYNLFCLETSKNGHSRVMYSPKIPSYSLIYLSLFSRCTILFPEISLLFSRSTFLFSRCAFSFLRNTLLFSSIWLQFSRSAFFLFTVHVFFQEWFFPADCALSLSGSQLLRDIMFALLLFYFLLELFADQLMMPSWKP